MRLETQANHPSLATIKQAILDAGFMPTKIAVIKTKKRMSNGLCCAAIRVIGISLLE